MKLESQFETLFNSTVTETKDMRITFQCDEINTQN